MRLGSGDTLLADMYPQLSMCGPNMTYTAVIVLKFQRDGSTRIKVHRSHCVCRQNMPRTEEYHIIYFFDSPKIFLLMKNPRRKLSYFSAHIS